MTRFLMLLVLMTLCAAPSSVAATRLGGSGGRDQIATAALDDRLGPKYQYRVPQPRLAVPSATPVAAPGGHAFAWTDAAIGAGVAGLLVAFVAGAAARVLRRQNTAGAPASSQTLVQ